jgi:hypothetical protein
MVMRTLAPKGATPAELSGIKEKYAGWYTFNVQQNQQRTILHDDDLVWDGEMEVRYHLEMVPLQADEAEQFYQQRAKQELIHAPIRIQVQGSGFKMVDVTSDTKVLECIDVLIHVLCEDKFGMPFLLLLLQQLLLLLLYHQVTILETHLHMVVR